MLGNRIKELREEKGLSQKELAKAIGAKTGEIAEWESGETEPTLQYLDKLTSVLDVSYDSLLNENVGTSEKQISSSKTTTNNLTTEETNDNNTEIVEDKKQSKSVEISKKPKKKPIIITIIIFVVLAVCFLLYFFAFHSTPFSKNTNEISKAENSVVKICCYGIDGSESATGSGFVYNDDKTIMTNYHVMTEAYTCKISTNKDISYEVDKIVAYSKEKDIAVLSLKESTELTPLTLGDSDLINKGETITAIGSPLGIKNVVSDGVLSGRIPEKNMEVLQFTASISNGSSGGALFNEKGEVVGITYASYAEGQNLNLAIPINEANAVYNNRQEEYLANSICLIEHPYFSNKNLFDQAQKTTLGQIASNHEYYEYNNTNNYVFDATVSSILDGQYIYIYTDNSVSKNYDYDNSNFESEDFENNHLIRIEIDKIKKDNMDNDIAPGDKIRIIANKIIYNERGEIDEFDGTEFTFEKWKQIKDGEGQEYIATLNRVGCWPVIIYKLN